MRVKLKGAIVEELFIYMAATLIVMVMLSTGLNMIDPTSQVTFTGVVEQIDDTAVKINTGQEVIPIQLDLMGDDTKNLKRMIQQGTKGSFYLINHKKDDTFVLKGLTHKEGDGVFSYRTVDNVKVIE